MMVGSGTLRSRNLSIVRSVRVGARSKQNKGRRSHSMLVKVVDTLWGNKVSGKFGKRSVRRGKLGCLRETA